MSERKRRSSWSPARLGAGWCGLGLAALLYVLLLALLFPEAVFEGKVFQGPDSVAPLGLAEGAAALDESGAHWNPFIFGGMPARASLSGDPDAYPPARLLRWSIDGLRLPPLTWLLVHYLWLALGIFSFLRGRGVRPWLAWLGGAFFILLPPQVAIGAHGHGSKVMTLAWLPWVLRFADRLMNSARDRRRLALADTGLLALALACLLLAAHIQVAYYTLLTLGLFGLARVALEWKRGGPGRALPPLGLALAALLLATAASLLLYLPVQEYSAYSIRGVSSGGGASYAYATAWSLHPAEWSSFIWPASWGLGAETYFGHMPMTDYANYLGLLPLLAAIPLFWRRPRNFDLFWLGLALFATLVAAGRHLPLLHRPLYDFLPGFNRFRVPVMILLLQQFAVALLFARGLELALRDRLALGRLRNLLVGGVLLLLISAAIGPGLVEDKAGAALHAKYAAQLQRAQPAQARQFIDSLSKPSGEWLREDALRGAFLLLLVLAAIEMRRRGGEGAGLGGRIPSEALIALACTLLLLGEFLPLDGRVVHPERHWEHRAGQRLWGKPSSTLRSLPRGTLRFLKENLADQRFYALPGSAFSANGAAGAGLASLGGYHAAKLALADSVLTGLPGGGTELLGRFAVRYILSPGAINAGPDFRPAAEPGSTEEAVYENLRALPRLRLTDSYIVEAPASSRARLLSGRAESGLTMLDRDPGFAVADSNAEEPGRILETDFGLDSVACRVSLTRPALLLLADMNYPGWRVSVDGQEAELLVADGFHRAVALPAGEHTVRFEFVPTGHATLGAVRITAFGAMALLIILGLPWRRPGEHRDPRDSCEEMTT
jgi:hypothetical protein